MVVFQRKVKNMKEALREVTTEEIETFWRDGIVCLRKILDPQLLHDMEEPVAQLVGTSGVADLSAMGDAIAASGQDVQRGDVPTTGRGRFFAGVDHWLEHQSFRDFSCHSILPSIAGQIMRSSRIHLWEDSVLYKEPGTIERTAWHQDMGYFHCVGDKVCTMWCPLDSVTLDSGSVRFVVGSHLWPDLYQPNLFVSSMVIPGTEGSAMPDVEAMARENKCQIVTFDTEPGDVTIHHARTIHGAGPNTSSRSRRAISLRYCGDDAVYLTRPGSPAKAHHHNVVEGAELHNDDCPIVWSRG